MKTTEEIERDCSRLPLELGYLKMRDHAKELELELEQSRQDRIAGAECSKRLAAKLAACSPNLSAALEWAASDGSDKDLAQRLENLGKWGMAGDNALEIVALEYERVMAAIREYRDAKGRHHTQIATERLFALLPESDQVEARRE